MPQKEEKEPVAWIECNGHMRPATDPCCWECIRRFNEIHGYNVHR